MYYLVSVMSIDMPKGDTWWRYLRTATKLFSYSKAISWRGCKCATLMVTWSRALLDMILNKRVFEHLDNCYFVRPVHNTDALNPRIFNKYDIEWRLKTKPIRIIIAKSSQDWRSPALKRKGIGSWLFLSSSFGNAEGHSDSCSYGCKWKVRWT